jgi:hypothetical protein
MRRGHILNCTARKDMMVCLAGPWTVGEATHNRPRTQSTVRAASSAQKGRPAPLRYVGVLGTGMRRVTVGFLGWFGPRGLASIVFVLILMEETELPEHPLMLTVATWTVALSVYAHGLTAWPGANRYADWYAAHATDHAAMVWWASMGWV